MNESKEQIVQKYYEQFKANEWANYLIPKLNPKSVNDENISIILDSNIKKAPLKSLTSFLKKTFTKKYPTAVKHIVVKPQTSKSEIAYQIVQFVDLSHPYSNNYVNKEHIVNEVQKDNENTTKYDEDSESEEDSEKEESFSEWEPESDDNDEEEEDTRLSKPNNDKWRDKPKEYLSQLYNKESQNMSNPQPGINSSPYYPHQKIKEKYMTNSLQDGLTEPNVHNTEENESPSPTITPYQRPRITLYPEDLNSTLDNYNKAKDLTDFIPDPNNEQESDSNKRATNETQGNKFHQLLNRKIRNQSRIMGTRSEGDNDSENYLSDGMRRLSIQDADPNIAEDKIPKKKKRKYMVNKNKQTILKENDQLNRDKEQLENEKKKMEEENNMLKQELEKQGNDQQELNQLLKNIEESVENCDENNGRKIIVTISKENMELKKENAALKKKLDEQRKRSNEKQVENKDLKKTIEKNLESISSLKTMGEKETALRAQNEGIINLQNEKIKMLETKIYEYQKLDEEYNDGSKTCKSEKDESRIKEDSEQNEEIERLKEELYLARHEINIRQQQLEEFVKSMATQLTEINLAHMETFANYKTEMQSRIEDLEKEKERLSTKAIPNQIGEKNLNELKRQIEDKNLEIRRLKSEIKTNQRKENESNKQIPEKPTPKENKTKQQGSNKSKEIEELSQKIKDIESNNEKLKEELESIGKQKIKEIRKVTAPIKKPQGLPNIGNICYINSSIHALANVLETNHKSKDEITHLIKRTQQCLNGRANEEEAENIIQRIWDISKEKWPEYIRDENSSYQEDAAEYINKLIEETNELKEKCTIDICKTITCKNPKCDIMSIQQRESKIITLTDIQEIKKEISLHNLVQNYTSKDKEKTCNNCQMPTEITYEIMKAPEILIIQTPRVTESGEKITTEIKANDRYISLKEKQSTIKYAVKSVIIHRGTFSNNGHYVANLYNEEKKSWSQIDDHNIDISDQVKMENRNGQLYILLRTEEKNYEKYQAERNVQELERKYEDDIGRVSSILKYIPNRNQQTKRNNEQNAIKNESIFNGYYRQQSRDINPKTETIPCKYYKTNNCKKGNECPFLHKICEHYTQGWCKFNTNCKYRHINEIIENKYTSSSKENANQEF